MRYFMAVLLTGCLLVGALFGLMGLTAGDNSALHEIEGLIGVLIVAVAAGAAYVGRHVGELKQPMPMPPPPAWIPPPPPVQQ